MYDALISFIITFLSAFELSLTDSQVSIFRSALLGFFSEQKEKDMAEIKGVIDPNQKNFSAGLIALLLTKVGQTPTEVKALMTTIANSIAAQGGVSFIGKKDSPEFFKLVFRGFEVLMGQEHEMSCWAKGTLESGRFAPITIGNKYVSKDGEKKSEDFTPACKELAHKWLTSSLGENTITKFLPSNVPSTLEEALPIVQKALTDRAAKSKTGRKAQ